MKCGYYSDVVSIGKLFDGFSRKNISQLESSQDSAHIDPIFLSIISLQTSAQNFRIQTTEENTLAYSVFNGIKHIYAMDLN